MWIYRGVLVLSSDTIRWGTSIFIYDMASSASRASKRLRPTSSTGAGQWICKNCLQKRSFASSLVSRQQQQQTSTTTSSNDKATHFGFQNIPESLKASRGTIKNICNGWVRLLKTYISWRRILLRGFDLRHNERSHVTRNPPIVEGLFCAISKSWHT